MNTQNNQIQNAPQPPEWGGYTLEELRYQRALSLIRLEGQKALLAQRLRPEKKFQQETGRKGFASNLIRRISEKMTFVDYLLVGYNLSKFLLRFKRKR